MSVRVGVVGTSWWADAMYLPALRALDNVTVVGVAGRDQQRTADFATRWEIAQAFTDADQLMDQDLDAVLILAGNEAHYRLTMAALERGLDVLCEKPLGRSTSEATEMAALAAATNTITMVPFTYRYMPIFQHVKQLIDDGYLGEPRHLGLRYFTGFAREGEYAWRFDNSEAGSGVIGDLGSHWLYLARWMFGEIVALGATSSRFVPRADRPDGRPYERGEDSAVLTARFESGAYATLQVSAVCWEGSGFGQTHQLDAHGRDGTLYASCDWQTVQEVKGLKAGDSGPPKTLPIPDSIWGNARRDTVHNTYRDVFRQEGAMVGDFVRSVQSRRPCTPNFDDGLRVQQLCDVAVQSAGSDGAMMPV